MFRRVVVAILLLFVAVAFVRTWLVEGLIRPQRIAGPSMSETLLGPHRQITCRDCGWIFPCAETLLHSSGLATCPLCGDAENDWRKVRTTRGSRIVIDRAAFDWREPERWEPIVFRCTEQPDQYCIKRVVGLPGERVELRGGEVYIDGAIVRKPLATAKEMNLTVHDSRYQPTRRPTQRGPSQRGWMSPKNDAEKSQSGWRSAGVGERGGGFTWMAPTNLDETSGQQHDELDWLAYHHRRTPDANSPALQRDAAHAVTDNYGANQNVSRRLHRVDDLMATATVQVEGVQVEGVQVEGVQVEGNRVEGGGSLWLRLVRRRFTKRRDVYLLRLDMDLGQVTLTCDGQELAAAPFDATLLRATPAQLDWGTIDRQVLLAIDDNVVLRYELGEETRETGSRPQSEFPRTKATKNGSVAIPPLAIGVAMGTPDDVAIREITIDSIRVWRDVYYLTAPVGYSPARAPKTYNVGPKEFFVLGDNSPVSLDSRVPSSGLVTAKSLIGRPIYDR